LFEELAPLLFTEDYVQRVWPLYSGSGFFPALILFALLGTLSAEAAAQLRELKGVMQAIAEPGVDASAASLAVEPRDRTSFALLASRHPSYSISSIHY
jgi:hypothetical protein